MKRLVTALVFLPLLGALAGCGEAASPKAAGGVDPRLVPPAAPTATPTPPASRSRTYALNEWANVANLRVRVTDVNQQDVSALNDTPDRAVMFEGCVQRGTYQFERGDFAASGSGYAQFDPSSSTARDFPKPRFPFGDGPTSAGDCAKGWVVFDTSADARLVNVAFAATKADTAVWVIN